VRTWNLTCWIKLVSGSSHDLFYSMSVPTFVCTNRRAQSTSSVTDARLMGPELNTDPPEYKVHTVVCSGAASQNPSRSLNIKQLRVKFNVFQLRKHCAKVDELTQVSDIFCFLPRSELFSWVTDSRCTSHW
jgi:hypothetical protein